MKGALIMQCKRCLYDETIPDCVINEEGICNYCIRHDKLEKEYPNDETGTKVLDELFARIKYHGKGKKYDCIVGISGGCDSSYLLDFVYQNGLRPLAVHFNNGWDTEIGKHNITAICSKLGIDLLDYKVNVIEYNDILRAFMLSGVVDIDAAADIGMIAAMYKIAHDNKIKYIVEGHSFRTEGIQPLSWAYVDGKYIYDVHKKYGTIKMKTYPNLWMHKFIQWTCIDKIKRVRPLYHIDYNKKAAKAYLQEEYGWTDYGGHHCENDFTKFNYSFFLRTKVDINERVNEYSALIRSHQMDKKTALELLQTGVTCPHELVERVKEELRFTDADFDIIMHQPLKTYHEFKTYQPFFVKTRLLWYVLYKLDIAPKSFYLKYCFYNFA